jgi:hypothetical protein
MMKQHITLDQWNEFSADKQNEFYKSQGLDMEKINYTRDYDSRELPLLTIGWMIEILETKYENIMLNKHFEL